MGIFLVIFLVFWGPNHHVSGQMCTEQNFEYTYTNCDANGERWRVAVPRGNAQCSNLPQPQKGLNCSFSCPPGNYLDIDSQHCRPCHAGFFSLGGGVRFEEFVTLPQGFSIDNFDGAADGFQTPQNVQECPKEAGWIVRDGELLYIPTPCISRLSFAANLVRAGSVEYTYRMPRNNRALSMAIDVRNEQCQSYSEIARSLLKYSPNAAEKGVEHKDGDWRRRTVELRSGQNVITWTVSNSLGAYSFSQEPIHFARIDVLGLAFTKQCTACPPGTYSDPGARECIVCKAGFFSSKGSAQCGRCPQSQYSGPKSERCLDRPPCRQQDYYPVREPCGANGTSRVTYKKVLPAVCREDLAESARLPAAGPWQPCPKCNPGMAKNKQGVCEFCEKDFYSEGNECKKCPVDTVPNYSIQYAQWETMPPKLTTRCEYISDDIGTTCDIGDSWIASGDSLISAPTLEKGIAFELVLAIDEGFWNPLAPRTTDKRVKVPVAQVTIVFETSCADSSCVLYFIEDVSAGVGTGTKESFYRFLAVFNGTQTKRVWSHTVTKNTPARYMLAFLRSGVASSDDSLSDVARIFAINVTNVGHRGRQGGGGSECLACPHSGDGDGCVPCPMGHYMHQETKICLSCPPNTIINATSSRVGVASCVACGQGLTPSTDGTSCVSPPKLTLHRNDDDKNLTYQYDFTSWRDKNWTVGGVRVFSREGTAYYHAFHVALFQTIKCEEAYDSSDVIGVMMDQSMRESVDGMACRMTALPSGNNAVVTGAAKVATTTTKNATTAFVSPLLLATKLDAITLNRTHNGWNLSDHVLEYEGLDNASLPLDVYFWFEQLAIAASPACPRGNIFVVVARCQPSKKEPEMRLPHSCPDGTCDGCMFTAILESSHACPICDKDDYETIKGECVNGKQTIHSIPHKHCVLTGSASESHEGTCSILSASQRMLLMFGSFSFVTLAIISVMMCRRNQRLEYKYTRLIESKTGELPAVETCGLDEDDDDDELQDRVIFSKGSSSSSRSRTSYNDRNSRDNRAFIALDNDD